MVRKIVIILASAFVIVMLIGASYQAIETARDSERFPPPGRLVLLNDIKLHIDCRGSGSPTVVLESGLGSSSVAWHLVMDEIAKHTRVCAYDRPGLGWSEPEGSGANAKTVASRLHELLNVAEIKPPYVLAGWSAGGVYIRSYYYQFPEDVTGMVFVDSSHEQQGDRLPKLPEGNGEAMLAACKFLQPLGFVRASKILEKQFESAVPDKALTSNMVALANHSHFCSAVSNESVSFTTDVRSPLRPATLGNLPLIVLTQGKPPEAHEQSGLTLTQAKALREAWNVLQDELTDLSTQGKHIIATESGHAIAIDQPALVIQAINQVVEETREK